MKIPLIQKDILADLNPTAENPVVILHGSNCFINMGKGVARYLSDKYPQVLEADRTTVKGDVKKLGTVSVAVITPNFDIVNCYTQYNYGMGKVNADYKAIRESLEMVAKMYSDRWEIRTVQIGCGLARGNWDKVESIMNNTFKGRKLTVYCK